MAIIDENRKVQILFPERLKMLRERRGWSMTETQRRLKIKTLSSYANYEYGERLPKYEMLLQIAELFDVDVNYLLGYDSDAAIEERKVLEAHLDDNVKRWVITELADVKEEDFQKLKIMWNVIKGTK